MSAHYEIRLARPQDVPFLPGIERAAGKLFAGLDVVRDATNQALPLEEFEEAQRAGRLWVAAMPDAEPIGFALVTVIDGLAHLDELDVRPDHGRRGLGTALVEAVCRWAGSAGFEAVTLSTFRDIPWNAPFYERMGFRVVAEDELTQGLLRLRQAEAKRGLPIGQRVVMRLELREVDA